MQVPTGAPESLEDLLARARGLSGRTVAEVAAAVGVSLPADPRREKGYLGRLVERALGESAKSRTDVTDYPRLGVELKTIPVDVQGRPRESTFVCYANLRDIVDAPWERSRVRQKLACVLLVPIESGGGVAFEARRLGLPVLFRPTADEEATLRGDYDELVGRIGRGEVAQITGHIGTALQLRPKAATGQARVRAHDADGTPELAMPRAFYLRPTFTAAILQRALTPEPA
jgi:DNA mismatch repair protein MutH